MTPWLQDADVTLYHGDALAVLRELPSESVDCCVTSPPYWGLRDYGQEGQLGLEPTPEEYVTRMVEVFREVRRVLAPHGTVWVNLGDSYGSGTTADRNPTSTQGSDVPASWSNRSQPQRNGLKPKDLVGIPWRVAFALQADGWYLRSDIIWAKPNPMPESVTDRPTKAHEYVFLFSKQPRYFFDQEAVREAPYNGDGGWRYYANRNKPDVRDSRPRQTGMDQPRDGGNSGLGSGFNRDYSGGRNIRSVWEIATQPFSGRELFGGDGRIPSPDCPVHGDRPVLAPTVRRDGHADTLSLRTQHSDDRLSQEQLNGPVPTEPIHEPDSAQSSSDSPLPASTATAIPSSTRTRKTSSHSDERGTASEETLDRTPGSAPSHESPALDGFDTRETTGKTDRTGRSSTLTGGPHVPPGQAPQNVRDRDPKACTCKHIDHFATFPEELARRCIAAGTSERGKCPECGAPWVREVEVTPATESLRSHGTHPGSKHLQSSVSRLNSGSSKQYHENRHKLHTVGWKPSCECGEESGVIGQVGTVAAPPIPAVVLDPFMGSGTVAHVARKLGRHAVGIDLNESYLELAARRLQQQSLFAEPGGVNRMQVRGPA